jgi:hypothetical protein
MGPCGDHLSNLFWTRNHVTVRDTPGMDFRVVADYDVGNLACRCTDNSRTLVSVVVTASAIAWRRDLTFCGWGSKNR